MTIWQLFTGSGLLLLSKFLNAIIQVVSLPIILKTFGKDEYGLIVIAMSLNTFLMIIQLGFPSGIPKFVAEWFSRNEHDKLKDALRSVSSFYFIIALLNALILIFIAIYADRLFSIHSYQLEKLRTLLFITAFASFFALPSTALDQALIGTNNLGFVSRMEIIKNLLFFGLIICLILFSDSISLTNFYAFRCLLMFIMMPLKLWKWSSCGSLFALVPGWKIAAVCPLLKYCLSISAFSIFIILSKNVPPVILALRAKSDAASVMTDFKVVDYIATFFLMISSTLITSLVPYISGLAAKGDIGIYNRVIKDGTRYVWAFGALIGFGVLMLSKEVIILYVGPEYLHIKLWLEVYIIGILYNLYNPAMSSVILSYGKLLPMIYATLLGCICSLFFSWMLSPLIGIGSISISLISFNLCAFLVNHFWYFPRYFHINPFNQIFHIFCPPLFAGLTMCISGRWLIDTISCTNSYINIAIGAFTGTLIYSSIILVFYISPSQIVSVAKVLLREKR